MPNRDGTGPTGNGPRGGGRGGCPQNGVDRDKQKPQPQGPGAGQGQGKGQGQGQGRGRGGGRGRPSLHGAATWIIAFVAKDFSRFSLLVDRLRREQGVELVPAATGAAGLAQLKGRTVDLVIVDEQLDDMSGIDFVRQLVKVNPLANTAIVGSLPEAEFHEVTEGLGVLMQLPPHPQDTDAEALLAVVAKISGLMPAGSLEAGR